MGPEGPLLLHMMGHSPHHIAQYFINYGGLRPPYLLIKINPKGTKPDPSSGHHFAGGNEGWWASVR